MPENNPFPSINNPSNPSPDKNQTVPGDSSFTPPPPNVFIHTSESDLNTLKSEGGEKSFNPTPTPPSPAPPAAPVSPPAIPPVSPSPMQQQNTFVPPSPESLASDLPKEEGSTPKESASIPSFSPEKPFSPQSPEEAMSINPEIPVSELSSFSSTPDSSGKKNKFLPFLIIGGIIIAGTAFGYLYLWPKLKPKPAPVTTTTTTVAVSAPTTTVPPFTPYSQISGPYQKKIVSIEIAGPSIASAIKESALVDPGTPGTFEVLVTKIHEDALTNEEVILSLIPNLPQRLKPFLLGRKYLLYTYHGEVHPSLGLLIDIGEENKEDVKSIFSAWAKGAILKDLSNFFLISIPKKSATAFAENVNAGAEIHYFLYSGQEAAITYAFFDRYLIISSSLESVNSGIDHLQGITEQIIP